MLIMDRVHTFDFLLNPLFGYSYCIKVVFDNNDRYDAISMGLISDWTTNINLIHVNVNLFKSIFYHISVLLPFWTLVLTLHKHQSKTYVCLIDH